MDIIFGFEPKVGSSNLPRGTKKMEKLLLIAIFLLLFLIPSMALGAGLVPCGGGAGEPACTIGCFFAMLANIYNFLVKMIATPLAILALTIGGVILLMSAGNPSAVGLGKKIIYSAIIGLVLVYCSWLIINVILTAIGFNLGSWFAPDMTC